VRPPDELGYFNAVRLPVARFTPGPRGRGAVRAINVALGRLECLVLIRDRDGTQERSLLTAKELRPGRKPPGTYASRRYDPFLLTHEWRCKTISDRQARLAPREQLLAAYDRGACQGRSLRAGRGVHACGHSGSGRLQLPAAPEPKELGADPGPSAAEPHRSR